MIALLLAAALSAAPVPMDEAGWVDVAPTAVPTKQCAKLANKASKNSVGITVVSYVLAAMANTHRTSTSGYVRVGGETQRFTVSGSYSDSRGAMRDLDAADYTLQHHRKKKILAQMEAAGCAL